MDPQQVLKYCPKCRAVLTLSANIKLECAACGFVQFINASPCVACILCNHEQEILLAKRKNEPLAGMWGLPGGFMELEENSEAAMLREIKEETGLVLSEKDLKYFGSYYDRYLYKGINTYTLCSIFSILLPVDQTPVAGDDALELQFFNKAELPWEQIAFVSVAKAIKDFIKR